MAPGGKQRRSKIWLLGRSSNSTNETNIVPQPLQLAESSLFAGAHHFVMHNPYFLVPIGDNTRGIAIARMINFLSEHIIPGAAYNDSARHPPPRCQTGTRVNLIEQITAWFDGPVQQELLLWITGPAGVGKSAIVQTLAEYLAKSSRNLLGASVFISRHDKRDNPHGIFITIAYQLTIHIEAYRDFVVEQLGRDPQCLNRDIKTQFETFIIEPFVERKIGVGHKRWGILLDGLDELKGDDAQCEIIELISAFVQRHRDAPLVWIIASRKEPRISNAFKNDGVLGSYWSRDIPIDNKEARDDVEHFLRSEFNTTHSNFRDSVPRTWPSNHDILKLAAAASGLFIYAKVVMEFIRDPDHNNPVSRLRAVLSIINRSNGVSNGQNPFMHLDALYERILSSVPSDQWPTTKHMLGFALYAREISYLGSRGMGQPSGMVSFTRRNLPTLIGMAILFDIHLHDIYACLSKCRSTLRIPNWGDSHKAYLTFFHGSFSDYLKDSARSRDFHVGNVEGIADVVLCRLLAVWNDCSGNNGATVESKWNKYYSERDDQISKAMAGVRDGLFRDVVYFVGLAVYRISTTPPDSPVYEQLCRVHMYKLCYYLSDYGLLHCVRKILVR